MGALPDGVLPASALEGAAAPLPPIERGQATLGEARETGARLGAHEHDRLAGRGRSFVSASDPKEGKSVTLSPAEARADRIRRAQDYAERWHALTGRLPL
jgi:hypothetical protein